MRTVAALREVVRWREMLINLVRRDLVVRYQRSLLGVLLALAVPVLATAVLSLFFVRLMPGRDSAHYPFLVFVGYMAWDYFQRTTAIAVDVLRGHADLIGKVYFPMAVLPLAPCFSVLVQLALGLTLGVIGNAVWGSGLHLAVLAVPLWVSIEVLMAAGVALIVSVLGVRFRDFPQLVVVLLMLLFYTTPIFWSPTIVRAGWAREVIDLNPLYHVVSGLRLAVVEGQPPQPWSFGYAAVWAFGTFLLGSEFFQSQRWRVTEEIG